MNRKLLLIPIVFIALVSLACSFTINLPQPQVKISGTVTDTITVPLPVGKSTPTNLAIQFGAGNLTLHPGATDALVAGTAKYNVVELKPVVTADANGVTIKQGSVKVNGLIGLNSRVINDWVLSLANSPMTLSIEAGAYNGSYELGGLSLENLNVTDGASKVDLSFSNPNQVEMSTLNYSTGASQVSITGLANANVNTVSFNGGAGDYTLDFSGQLQRDMTVSVESGVSSVTIKVPKGVQALVTTESALISVSTSADWSQNGNNYQLTGSGHTITILAKMGAGSLRLETSQ